MKSKLELRQNAIRGGAHTIIKSESTDMNGSVVGSSQVPVEPSINKNAGIYRIFVAWDGKKIEQSVHIVYCHRETCTTYDGKNPLRAGQERVTVIDSKLGNLTHLHGSQTEQGYEPRDYITGQQVHTIAWDVSWIGK